MSRTIVKIVANNFGLQEGTAVLIHERDKTRLATLIPGKLKYQYVDITADLESLEPLTEEVIQKLRSITGWEKVGNVLYGPVGLIAGFLGGKKKKYTFVIHLSGERKVILTVKKKVYEILQRIALSVDIAARVEPNTVIVSYVAKAKCFKCGATVRAIRAQADGSWTATCPKCGTKFETTEAWDIEEETNK